MRSSLISLLCLVACGGKQPPPPVVQNAAPPEPVAAPTPAPESGAATALAKMTEYADRMCLCADKPCADAVMSDMTQWAEAMAKASPAESPKPTEADMKKMTEIGTRFAECMTKAMTPPP